jgi:hypothetical protein
MSAILELAARVEALTGPDREVDADIMSLFTHSVSSDDGDWWCGPHDASPIRVPEFTASLDAAMTLVPEKWKLRQMQFAAPCADCRKWQVQFYGGREGEDYFVSFAATPTLALCAASLRARAETAA